MLTGDKQKMEGAEKMCTQQTFSGSSESEAAGLGLLGQTSRGAGLMFCFLETFCQSRGE